MNRKQSLIAGISLVVSVVSLVAVLWAQVGVKSGKVRGVDAENGIRILDQKTQTLHSQLKEVQVRINAAKTPPIAGVAVRGKVAWTEPVNDMRSTLASMHSEVNELLSYYRSTRIAHGTKLASELQANLTGLGAALDKLATTSNAPQAKVSANGINASVNKVLWLLLHLRSLSPGGYQGITEGEAEGNHQSICDAQEGNLPPGTQCVADCTLTTTGSDPGPIDDEFSCTCNC